ncbi:hypothetical protein [[Clostridium] fimetarium]|uniref:Uncharacterized protein n=1 Tax=[Clostridium] fimetarium TaxID=99656 RepID=A0A1I0NY91_9FIRM|nr:hypothetical protein [[Clostridium] fimetarium]SEW06804.1 hypothetical protein SAMN05421659_1043 [[Clostridium] fimetarium]
MKQSDDEIINARIKKSKSMELASLIIWLVGIIFFNVSKITDPALEVVLIVISLSAMVFYILLRFRRYQYESKK